MIKVIFTLALWLSFVIGLSSQNILNVANDLRLPGIYSTFQAAVNAASPGDTIHVHPNTQSYGNGTISKKLVIIGAGYDMVDQSDSLGIKTISANAFLGDISFNAGSDSSVIMGCQLHNVTINDPVKHVTCLRNKVMNYFTVNGADSITINGCFLSNRSINIQNTSQGNVITNNILNSTSYGSISVDATSNAIVQRNIIAANCNIQNSTIVDNVFIGSLASTNSVVTNNLFMANLPQYAGPNLVNLGSSGIFVGYPDQLTYSFDDRWKLAPGSPAIGYAFDGGDCGVFDGEKPYKLSGVPSVPLIYELNIIDDYIIENDSLHINIKVRSEQ